MNERMEISGAGAGQEEIPPGLLASMKIEENSPEFQALKASVSREMQASSKRGALDDKLLIYLTHLKIITAGLNEDDRKVMEEVQRGIEERSHKPTTIN